MSRVFSSATTTTVTTALGFGFRPSNCSLRFYRKPRWVGVGVSKRSRSKKLEEEVKISPENKDEVVGTGTRKDNSYKIYSKSVWAWQNQILRRGDANDSLQNSEDVDLRRIIRHDGEPNVRVKTRRDRDILEEWANVVKEIQKKKLLGEIESNQRMEKCVSKVLSDMEKLKTSVSLEDLDEAIESALSSEVEYNFAIDKAGNVYNGRPHHHGWTTK